jgi:hypothetical protein
MVRAQKKLNEAGILHKAPSGYVLQSALLAAVNTCIEAINKLSREFGLTPIARIAHLCQPDGVRGEGSIGSGDHRRCTFAADVNRAAWGGGYLIPFGLNGFVTTA